MENFNLSEEQMEKLLSTASAKLGADKSDIKESISNGGLSKLFGKLKPNDAQLLSTLMKNPQMAEKLLSNPQVQSFLKQNIGEKKD
jgi:hypothetical protein